MAGIYESGEYLAKHPTWHRDDSLWKTKQITRVLSQDFLAENFSSRRLSIVDIGCGGGGIVGHLRQMLVSKGYRVNPCKGIDIADSALEMARKRWPNIEFLNCDIAELDGHFDIGLLIDVIEHIQDPGKFVKLCSKSCDYLILHIPLEDNYNAKIRSRHQYYLEDVGHIHYFNSQTALSFLERNGLRILDSRFTKGFLCSKKVTAFSKLAFPGRLVFSSISESLCARTLGGISQMVLTKTLR